MRIAVLVAVMNRHVAKVSRGVNLAPRWIAVVVHDLEEIELVPTQERQMGVDGGPPGATVGGEMVLEAHGRMVGLVPCEDRRHTLDGCHSCHKGNLRRVRDPVNPPS